jgi:hypothetical protein
MLEHCLNGIRFAIPRLDSRKIHQGTAEIIPLTQLKQLGLKLLMESCASGWQTEKDAMDC